jgi:hypothetical protein
VAWWLVLMAGMLGMKVWVGTIGLFLAGGLVGPAVANSVQPVAPAEPQRFYDWCMLPQKSAAVKATVEALFWAAGTKRCERAAQYLVKQEVLDLTGLGVRDLRPIAGLPQVKRLVLDRNPITDLGPLGALKELQVLSLNQSSLRRLDGVERIGGLQALALDRTLVRDLGPIRGLGDLRELSARGDRLRSIAVLAELKRLRYLALEQNLIEELTPLTFLNELEELHLASNAVRGIAPLSGLTKLQVLRLNSNPIEDLEPLQSLRNLKQLELLGILAKNNPCPPMPKGGTCVYYREPKLGEVVVPDFSPAPIEELPTPEITPKTPPKS